MHRVFVTGLGFITSIGNDAGAVTTSLREQRHGFEAVDFLATSDSPVRLAAPVKGFDTRSTDPEDWEIPAPYRIRREFIRSMSPHVAYAWCAMQQAISDARLTPENVSDEGTGIYTASGGSAWMLSQQVQRMNAVGPMRCPPLGIVASIAGTLSFNLVAHFRIQGASTGFASACASSAHALGFAADEIAMGRQRRMFVVGAEDANRESILPFAGMRALSIQTDPAVASRPFDVARDGFVATGGAAVVVLESEEEVLRRGVTPYMEFLGWGQASDGHNVATSHPEGAGLRRAMQRALAAAKLAPNDVDHINAHATSTPIGDAAEAKALASVFAEHDARPAIAATKSITGHGLSLAGVMEAGFCALAMRDGFTPGTAHTRNLDPLCAGLDIVREVRDVTPRVALSNSSGFGGANVCLAFRAMS